MNKKNTKGDTDNKKGEGSLMLNSIYHISGKSINFEDLKHQTINKPSIMACIDKIKERVNSSTNDIHI